jgi:hypothetical protein
MHASGTSESFGCACCDTREVPDALNSFRRRALPGFVARIAIALTVVVAAGCTSSTSHKVADPGRPNDVVPLTVLPFNDSLGAGRPVVTVRIGADPPVRVLLDTGSVGLSVMSSALPMGGSGIAGSPWVAKSEYRSGLRLLGRVDYAVVTVGDVKTTRPIPIDLVSNATCATSTRDLFCPGAQHHGVVGILGIGLHAIPANWPVNPLESLPAPDDETWSIALHQRGSSGSGSLVLGASIPHPHLAPVHLTRQSAPQGGISGWNDRPRLCIFHTYPHCGSTLIDTGAMQMQQNVPQEVLLGSRTAIPGTRITLLTSRYGSPVWTFKAGRRQSNTLSIGNSPPSVWAVPLFYAKTVTYDSVHGVIDISRSPANTTSG